MIAMLFFSMETLSCPNKSTIEIKADFPFRLEVNRKVYFREFKDMITVEKVQSSTGAGLGERTQVS